MKTAHYVTGKNPVLIISETMQPVGTRYPVTGKAEARKLAATHAAKPWNF